jgi:hypothetical protein
MSIVIRYSVVMSAPSELKNVAFTRDNDKELRANALQPMKNQQRKEQIARFTFKIRGGIEGAEARAWYSDRNFSSH